MRRQAFNPYLPSYEYVPDGEPHVFDQRVYVYGSHDLFDGRTFCLGDYVCYSAPVEDLSDWRFEGVILKKEQTPRAGGNFHMYAPDCAQGPDGRYYLYYFGGRTNVIYVAVSSSPAGPFDYYGKVVYANGVPVGKRRRELRQFDPAVLVDDDGRIYLYSGFGPIHYPRFMTNFHAPTKDGAFCYELEEDMLTVKTGPRYIGVIAKAHGKGTPFEGHEFFEASSIRKIKGKYYFVYSSFLGHELCYAISDYPDRGFSFGGTLVSIGDIGLHAKGTKDALNYTGNTHGGILNLDGKYYIFYHRQTNLKQFSRQACAERIFMDENGKFSQVEVTSCGLNDGPLPGKGRYEARIACNLMSRKGTRFYWIFKAKMLKRAHPYFTQYGKDREDHPDQHIANFNRGSIAGFKYFQFDDAREIRIRIKGNPIGRMKVSVSIDRFEEDMIAEIPLMKTKGEQEFCASMKPLQGVFPLYFRFDGKGRFDFLDFLLI